MDDITKGSLTIVCALETTCFQIADKFGGAGRELTV